VTSVKANTETLRRIYPLIDELIDLDEAQRESWLSGLQGDAAELAPLLRELLSRKATQETADLIDSPPDFAALGVLAQEAAPEFSAGAEIGPYRLLRQLGTGGMGEVWLAERADSALNRVVALKLPVLSLRRNVLVQRFARERDILGSLAHPNIARLYDAGIADNGQPYLALEYVEGQPITTYADEKKLDVRARIGLLQQVMDAVQYAHANLVVHRDLKPGNVLVNSEGRALLLDFGIAKLLEEDAGAAGETELTRMGGRALTLHYAAPEQIAGRPVSIHTDNWALGVLLYELVTGRRPFDAPDRVAVEQAVLREEPQAPSLCHSGAMAGFGRGEASDLDTIILKALKKEPTERYATVSAFKDDLDRLLRGEPVEARPDSTGYRMRKFVGRYKKGVTAVTLLVVVLSAFSVTLSVQVHKVTRERDRADRIAGFMSQVFKVANPTEANSAKVTARELLDTAAGAITTELAADPELRARLAQSMARAYTQLGALDRADALLHREYEQSIRALGADHPSALSLGAELAWLLYAQWKVAPAEALAREILARQRQVLGSEHRSVAVTESHLSTILGAEGKFDEAIELRRHSMGVSRKEGADDLAQLDEQASLAYDMLRSGKIDPVAAERIFKDLHARYSSLLGPGHLNTLLAANGLAAVLARLGQHEAQTAVLAAAVAEGRKSLGVEHPRVLDLINNLAAALVDAGDLAKAEPLLRESVDINTRIEGANSSRAAMAKYNLACVLARRQDKDGALVLLADALDHGLIPDAALEMEKESDLKSLHGDARFTDLIRTAKARFGSPR
jgi:serine/threonine protein kinase